MAAGQYLRERKFSVRRLPKWNRFVYVHDQLHCAIAEMVNRLNLTGQEAVLDFGCANQQYRYLFSGAAQYVGADIPGNPEADVDIQPSGRMSVEGESVDVVLSTQVLEHVESPSDYLREAYRILKPGGRLLLSTHGFFVYHEDPVDYWRWTGPGLERELENAGFQVDSIEGVVGLAAVGIQLFQDAIFPRLPRLVQPIWALVMQGLVSLFDRFHSDNSRIKNAMVYVVIASRER